MYAASDPFLPTYAPLAATHAVETSARVHLTPAPGTFGAVHVAPAGPDEGVAARGNGALASHLALMSAGVPHAPLPGTPASVHGMDTVPTPADTVAGVLGWHLRPGYGVWDASNIAQQALRTNNSARLGFTSARADWYSSMGFRPPVVGGIDPAAVMATPAATTAAARLHAARTDYHHRRRLGQMHRDEAGRRMLMVGQGEFPFSHPAQWTARGGQ